MGNGAFYNSVVSLMSKLSGSSPTGVRLQTWCVVKQPGTTMSILQTMSLNSRGVRHDIVPINIDKFSCSMFEDSSAMEHLLVGPLDATFTSCVLDPSIDDGLDIFGDLEFEGDVNYMPTSLGEEQFDGKTADQLHC